MGLVSVNVAIEYSTTILALVSCNLTITASRIMSHTGQATGRCSHMAHVRIGGIEGSSLLSSRDRLSFGYTQGPM